MLVLTKVSDFHFHFSDQGCLAGKPMHSPESTKVWSSQSLSTVSKARGSQTCVHITINGKAGFKHIQISGLPSQPSDFRTLGVGPVIFIGAVFPHTLPLSLQGSHLVPTVALRIQIIATGGSVALNSAMSLEGGTILSPCLPTLADSSGGRRRKNRAE